LLLRAANRLAKTAGGLVIEEGAKTFEGTLAYATTFRSVEAET
jgi:hypothetical protein